MMLHEVDYTVATKQREVYDWYEARHSHDEVVDIYSPEWEKRINDWKSGLEKRECAQDAPSGLECLQTPDDLDGLEFAPFFFAHPIAAFALWQVLQACFEIDLAVGGANKEKRKRIKKWQEEDKPFAYLKAEKIRVMCEYELKELAKQISSANTSVEVKLNGEVLKSRIFSIFGAVERLEKSMDSLQGNFGKKFCDSKVGGNILSEVRKSVDDRCLMITNILKVDKAEQEKESTTSEQQSTGLVDQG
jgi:hypothetical protein